jgi:lycopene cyclase domain-containing protein
MKEYTVLALLSAVLAVLIDHSAGTRVTRRGEFWVFMAVMVLLKVVVNGYLTGRPIVLYGEPFFLGLRIWTIPVEDFAYGFGLITMSIVCWEFFLGGRQKAGRR